ncbi:hypothetical protein OESDEN_21724 [Oesophagostomum dentatum]|uniref:DNA2/NAM7 helicase helicase domain-containing protein n=1 Tax=Oesophagostomum dentatum TaxID=61180 RepID=A0A0B1S020_OESDE|nr:hypothetical protein OESDEN_21724 [Oesophagostomum dentatum]
MGVVPVIVTTSAKAAIAQFTETTLAFQGSDGFQEQLTQEEWEMCIKFKEGRELLEEYLFHSERALEMSEEEKDEHSIAEEYVPGHLQGMVDLMFDKLKPSVMYATSASLLNVTDSGGLLAEHIDPFRVLIGDEASQIPEPVFVAMAARLRILRHVYAMCASWNRMLSAIAALTRPSLERTAL